jgi:hypothetical protein
MRVKARRKQEFLIIGLVGRNASYLALTESESGKRKAKIA